MATPVPPAASTTPSGLSAPPATNPRSLEASMMAKLNSIDSAPAAPAAEAPPAEASPAPAPQVEATPATPAPAEATPTPTATPAVVAAPDADALPAEPIVEPEPAAPAEPEVLFDTSTPEGQAAHDFIVARGGDPTDPKTWVTALAQGMEYNNRLAALAKQQREAATQVQSQAAQTQITEAVNRLTDSDQQCAAWAQEWHSQKPQVVALNESIKALTNEIAKAEMRLTLPEVQADQFKIDQITAALRDAKQDKRGMIQDLDRLEARQKKLSDDWDARVNWYRTNVTTQVQAQFQKQAEAAARQESVAQHAARVQQEWPKATKAAMAKFKIPGEELHDFIADLEAHALSYDKEITNTQEYVDNFAKRYAARMDRTHRLKSAEYGDLARTRVAATAAPVVVVPAPAPAQAPQPRQYGSDPQEELRKAMRAKLANAGLS